MIFPFFNSWSLSAASPALVVNGAIMYSVLDLYRSIFDASFSMLRAQEDIFLQTIAARIAQSRDGQFTTEEAVASPFSPPMLDAVNAFAFWNDAVLRAEHMMAETEIAD